MEKEAQLENLEKRRNNIQRSNMMCYLGMMYLGYSIIDAWNSVSWYFHGIMLVMIAIIFAISRRSKKYVKELTVEIEALREELGMNDPGYWEALENQEDDGQTHQE